MTDEKTKLIADINEISAFARSKGFDLNFEKVLVNILGKGLQLYEGIVLTKDRKIISNNEDTHQENANKKDA